MAFSPDFLDDIRGRVGLAGVIGRRVRLKKRGREHLGLCPFHKEKTPSFTVNEDKGFFHCFGCGAHGDVIEFVMRTEGLAFPEAVESLAGTAGLALPAPSPEAREREREQRSLQPVVEAACRWFEGRLGTAQGRRARAYLAERGVDEATIARFRLGFAPDSRGGLKAALAEGAAGRGDEGLGAGRDGDKGAGPGRAQGAARERFPEAALIAAGLLIEPEGKGAAYDRFRGRIIFPISDRRGRVIAFGGRLIEPIGAGADQRGRDAAPAAGGPAGGGARAPKYLNSPDTPLFHKGRVLYNFAAARAAAAETGEIIVAEGYMDVIALAVAGFNNAVAPLGTALTEDQIRELWRAAAEPVLCFDGDEAGRRAAAGAAARALPLLRPGFSLRFAVLPAGEDPDSLVRGRGAAAMREVLDGARPLSDVVWEAETLGRPVDTPERRANLTKRLDELAAAIADARVRDEYRRHFRDRVFTSFPVGRRAAREGRHPSPQDAGRAKDTRLDSGALLPRILLAAVINHPEILDEVGEELGNLQFSPPGLDRLRQDVLEIAAQPALDRAALKNHLLEQGHSDALRALLGRDVYLHAAFASPEASVEDVRRGWRHASGRYRLPVIRAQLQEAEKAFAASGGREDSERLVNLRKRLHEAQKAVSGMEEPPLGGRADSA